MRILIRLGLVWLVGLMVASGAEWPHGISRDLARHRAAQLSELHYDLNLRIPKSVSAPITARLTLQFKMRQPDQPVVLDFDVHRPEITRLTCNGEPLVVQVANGHLMLPADRIRLGANELQLDFVAGDGPLNRTEDGLYSLFVPDRASTCFPCFDQPDLKAVFRLKLEVPEGWTAIEYQETRPVSTYLFAFAAGKYFCDVHEGVKVYHRETDPEKRARNLPVIFQQHQDAVRWMARYTSRSLPFRSFDVVLIPGFQYGGMEHVGHIFYRAESLLLDASATLEQELGRASLIAHETAHMWFGNLVTMEWFNDVWLKEVFANLMAAKIVHPLFPEIDHELRFLLRHYPGAFAVDRTSGANPVVQDLANLNQAGSLYGAIIYLKAPIGMRMLEERMGAEPFREGLRDYLAAYAYENATWAQLLEQLQAHTDQELKTWSTPIFEQSGLPELRAGHPPFEYGFASEADPITMNAVPVVRARQWMNRWELMQHQRYLPARLLQELMQHLPAEENPQVAALMLDYLQGVFWRFSNPEQRAGCASELEALLQKLLESEGNLSIRKAVYHTVVKTAYTDQRVAALEGLWRTRGSPPGFELAEDDYTKLACELALRGVYVLDEQLARIKNPDRRARLLFLAPALSADVAERDAFFARLAAPENRAREPWVLQALRYLHHPLRAVTSEKYLRPSMEMLEDIQRTGDIFFPRSWLDATFSGHQSPAAAENISAFLDQESQLSTPLRMKLQQAADPVWRAARILSP